MPGYSADATLPLQLSTAFMPILYASSSAHICQSNLSITEPPSTFKKNLFIIKFIIKFIPSFSWVNWIFANKQTTVNIKDLNIIRRHRQNCNHQISAITNVLVVFFWKMPRTFSYCSHDGGKQNCVEKMNAAFCWKYLALINKLLSLVWAVWATCCITCAAT